MASIEKRLRRFIWTIRSRKNPDNDLFEENALPTINTPEEVEAYEEWRKGMDNHHKEKEKK